MSNVKDEIKALVEAKQDEFFDASDKIWEFAETRFEEFQSAKLLEDILAKEGFTVKSDLADMKTAFIAEYGSGKPVIAILGEFDALYGLSQKAGVAQKDPLVKGGKGHGCGHNILGGTALAAAVAAKDYMVKHNLTGTIRYYGCPGEESGSGKAYIARAGLFDDVDVALTHHPSYENSITGYNFLATLQVAFKFHGKGAHAAACPHLGRSALDAVELMNVGANFLREHVIQEARIHYAITDAGGCSPNVVQPEAAVLYQIRTPQLPQANEIYDRVVKIAQGAALMTETRLEIVFDRGSSNIIPNRHLEKLAHDCMTAFGPEPISDEDLAFAKEIEDSLEGGDKTYSQNMLDLIYGPAKGVELGKLIKGKLIMDTIYPYTPTDVPIPASTDVGDVSWNVPVVQVLTNCYANNTPNHSWQQVAQGKSPLAHKGLLLGGKTIALAAVRLLQEPELVKGIRDEFTERMDGRKYVCPIPPEVKPAPHR